jgi:Zn-dependent protease
MTRGSFGIGELFGIPIRMHWSLVALVVLWLFLAPSAVEGLRAVLVTLLVFGSVLAHELGHALVARRFRVQTREIVLMPLGGVALLDDRPARPWHELVIAFAGPLVSLVLGGLAFAVYQFYSDDFVADLGAINLMLGVFNLVPAFPLDGGRMLRSGLQMRLGLMRATRIAARVGRIIAAAAFVYALWHHQVFLAFIAIFIFMAGTQEERQQLIHGLVSSQSVFGIMQHITAVVPTTSRADEALRILASQPGVAALPVVYGDRVIGIVHRQPVVLALAQGEDPGIANLVDRNIITHDGDGPLMPLLMRMQAQQSHAAVIMRDDHITGIITLERLADAFQQALGRTATIRRRRPRPPSA